MLLQHSALRASSTAMLQTCAQRVTKAMVVGRLSLHGCPMQVAAGGEAAAEAVAAQRRRTRARKRALAEQRRAAVMAAMAAAQAGPDSFCSVLGL